MQPNTPLTGFDPQSAPNQGLPTMPQTGPVSDPMPQAALSSPVSSTPMPPSTSSSTEQWVADVERVIAETAQSPKQRADAIASLKARYQQQVLGLKVRTRTD